jgi:translation initiation factor 3 subunit F
MLASAKSNENRTASLISDMDHLEIAISKLQEMLERISKYVESVVVSSEERNFWFGMMYTDICYLCP